MESKRHNQCFSLFQFVAGLLATVLVIFSYVKFHKPLQYFFEQLSAGGTVVSLKEVLDGAKSITEHVGETIVAHHKSVDAISQSTREATDIIDQWKGGTATFSKVLLETAQVTDTFAQHLPFHLPSVHTTNHLVKFHTPEISSKVQEVNIPYPVITQVHEQTREIKYPNDVVVQTENFRKDLGHLKIKKRNRTKGSDSPVQQIQQSTSPVQQEPAKDGDCVDCMKLGVITFDYPADIEVQHDRLSITYPDQLSIGSASKKISVPDLKVSMKEHRINIPQVTVENRPILKDEKVILHNISKQLKSIATFLGTTQTSFDELLKQIEETRSSLDTTKDHLVNAGKATGKLHRNLTELAEELEARTNELQQLRKKFAAIAGLIPLLFIVLGLLCAATAASGAAKLCVYWHDRKGCPPDETSEEKGSCSAEQEPQPDTPQQQGNVIQEPTEPDPYQHSAEQGREK